MYPLSSAEASSLSLPPPKLERKDRFISQFAERILLHALSIPIGIGAAFGVYYFTHSMTYVGLTFFGATCVTNCVIALAFWKNSHAPSKAKVTFEEVPATQTIIPKEEIFSSTPVAIPTESYPPDQKQIEKYLNSFQNVTEKQLAQKVFANIQHITFEQFNKELGLCIERLNSYIEGKPYTIGIAKDKSNEWTANLAKDQLTTLPSQGFYLENKSSYSVKVNVRYNTDLSGINEQPLVLFDDCAYSGTQIIGHLRTINEQIKAKGFSKKTTVYVVIPFMSEACYNIITNKSNYSHLNVTCITSTERIKQLHEIFDDNEFAMLNGQKVINDSPFESWRGRILSTQTLCYTDWRIPDGSSFPSSLINLGAWVPDVEEGKPVTRQEIFNVFPQIPRLYGIKEQTP